MDGFNVIPVDNSFKSGPTEPKPITIGASSMDPSVEIIDEEKERQKQASLERPGIIYYIAIVFLVGTFLYLAYLIYYRIYLINQITYYGEELRNIGKNIDLKEMQEFQAMDTTLKAINSKMDKHILTSQIMSLVNQNIRKTLQVTEYRLDVRQNEVEVNLTAVSPSFKELAEQTEKIFALRESGKVQNFSVSNLSFEAETRRLKFSLKLIFDKSKFNAVSMSQTNE